MKDIKVVIFSLTLLQLIYNGLLLCICLVLHSAEKQRCSESYILPGLGEERDPLSCNYNTIPAMIVIPKKAIHSSHSTTTHD